MQKEVRQKKIKFRKNFFATFIISVTSWLALLGFTYVVGPDSFFSILTFLFLVFLACFFTTSVIVMNSRRGLIAALGLTVFVCLRILGLGNALNLFLIAGIVISADIYLAGKR